MAYNHYKKWNNSPAKNGNSKGVLVEDFYNPYSFVPIADAPCFLPEEEAKRVMFAQDIPYSDGLSGHIDVHFRAETPLCVKQDNGHPDSVNVHGKYFIPGASVKGMLRNVLEVLSLSNIRNVMADNRYSMRDMGKNSTYSLKAVVDGEKAGGQKPGFLFMINYEYFVMPCDASARQIPYRKMDHELQRLLTDNRAKIDQKYKKAGNGGFLFDGGLRYMWLFSGFMNNKKHEYMLPVPDFSGKALPLKGRALRDFLFIHEEENENKSWSYWKSILNRSKYHTVDDLIVDNCRCIAPCFFRTEFEDGEEVVRDLGFSFLYREPYRQTVSDLLLDEYKSDGMDIASAIFGFTNSQSLKGRVQVQNAFIDDASVDTERSFILGSPKPTFCPFYIEQPDGEKPRTYSTSGAIISGWKRYLVHPDGKPSAQGVAGKGSASSFSPLKKGTEFITRINYHNLRPFELGAMLAAVTFNGNSHCCHSLGYAKPYGYGKLTVTKVDTDLDIKSLMDVFRSKVCNLSGLSKEDWDYNVAPLVAIASGDYRKQKIRYPYLDKNDSGDKCKEFNLIRDKRKSILDFSPVDE